MTFDQFKRLVRGGEKATVDFKVVCNAFNKTAGDHEKAKAELVKDICAMANNGSQASYLIIGVANDGKTLKSVSDPHLTSTNIHTLLRDSIHPRPFIRIHDLCWPSAPEPFTGVRFLVIQVGPNAKAVFRFSKDCIQDSSKYCFRKHQAWVRNGDTSDIATPEQIVALATRRPKNEPEPEFHNTNYSKLEVPKQLPTLLQELRGLFSELGFKITPTPPVRRIGAKQQEGEFRVSIPIRDETFVFRCCARESLNRKLAQPAEVCRSWQLEHGLLVVLTGAFSKAAKVYNADVDFPASWGSLMTLKPAFVTCLWMSPNIPRDFGSATISAITIPRITDTRGLRQAVTTALRDLEGDDTLFSHANRARIEINSELKRWKRKYPASFPRIRPFGSEEEMDAFEKSKSSMLKLLDGRD